MCEYDAKYPECNYLGMHYHIPCICPDISCLCNRKQQDPKHTAYRAPCGNLSHDIKCQCHLTTDLINHPPHYTQGGIDTFDFIKAKGLSYAEGNVIKYITRSRHKGKRLDDLKKAEWYLKQLIMEAEHI